MNYFRKLISIILSVLFVLCLVSCGDTAEESPEAEGYCDTTESTAGSLWDDALYQEDTTFGEGELTAVVKVKAEDKTVTFTINTDKTILGEALFEHNLIDGEEGPYGLYIKKVNGITADYDVNQCYWAFYIDGETALTGVDGAEITEGVTYQLEYTKQ